MVTIEQRREYVSVSLQTAANWREKQNPAWEERSLSSAIMNFLAIAVLKCSNGQEAKEWFDQESEFGSVLLRYAEVFADLVRQIDAGKVPASIIAGNYPHLVFTHLTWALSDIGVGEQFAGIAARSDVLELSTQFWREYAMAVQKLIAGEPYTVGDVDVEGQEQYWLAYLHLIERATSKQDTTSAVAAINDAFTCRNSDNAINDDAHEIEGSGGHPVRWDFRRDGLLNYIKNKQ